jgi:Domain of unknown function (DUF4328)
MNGSGPPDAPKPPAAGAINPYAPPTASLDAAAGGIVREADGFKSATTLANAITVVMALEAVISLLGAANAGLTISVMRRVIAGETVEQAGLVAIDSRAQVLASIGFLILLAAAVLFCLFMPRANRNARAFGSPMTNTPGWAAGWFFVPFASLWKPYYAMKEIWQGSDPDPSAHALLVRVPTLLPLWWWMFIGHSVTGQAGAQIYKHSGGPSGLITASWANIVSSGVTIAAAVLAALVVRAVARRRDERQRRHPAGTPLPAPAVTAGVAP